MSLFDEGLVKSTQPAQEKEGGDAKVARKRTELGSRTQYPLRMPEEMHEDFQAFAKEDGMTLHAYFMKVLSDHCRRRKRKKNKE